MKYGFTDILIAGILAVAVLAGTSFAGDFKSHPPTRPLPQPSSRPIENGPAFFVDPVHGNDDATGSKTEPWRTVTHAVDQLRAGDTLYLRGGTYYEHVTVRANGTPQKPITIRSMPNELAVIDGGMREFFESPESAWEPNPDGIKGEFRSVKTYPELDGSAGATNLLGNFGDSMVPLHGYRFITDLRNSNEYFHKLDASKTEAGNGIYCGPGVFHDVDTGRIHVRLAHTHQQALGDDNYRGETDPRKVQLVIASVTSGPTLSLENARYVRVQDIVVRGARTETISVSNSFNIEFDGVTSYGGYAAMRVRDSGGLRLWNCALRGIAAPWTWRGSLKYRALEARIFSASGWSPTGTDNHDFELAHSEFTDSVDGVFIGNVRNVRFHHNLLDNLSDDGIFLTARTAYDGTTPGGNIHIYQNLLSRCLTTFAFGVGHGRQKMTPTGRQAGAGVFIYRNVFDFRRPVMYQQPKEDEPQITSYGRVAGDHGGPLWEPMTFYHNTFVGAEPPFRSYYLAGLGGHLAGGSMRRVFNNISVQANGSPGAVLPPVILPESNTEKSKSTPASKTKADDPLSDLLDDVAKKSKSKIKIDSLKSPELAELKKDLEKKAQPKAPLPIDFQADGNLHWSYAEKPEAEKLLARFRNSPDFESSKALYQPGWTTHDVIADPKLAEVDTDWQSSADYRLSDNSPAINAGVNLPVEWTDPLESDDDGKPDIGAVPVGVQPWPVGVAGRLSVFGTSLASRTTTSAPAAFLLDESELPQPASSTGNTQAMIIQGYPAFDAPLIEFALRKSRTQFTSFQRTWVKPSEYQQQRLVIIVGDLPRAGIKPNRFSEEDLRQVDQFMRDGGTLTLMRGNNSLFNTDHGREYLIKLTGTNNKRASKYEILQPNHPWISHLNVSDPPEWINARNVQPIRATNGTAILGSPDGLASLYQVSVGKGQLIYVGWDIASSLPHGRRPSTPEQESLYEQQMEMLSRIITSTVPENPLKP